MEAPSPAADSTWSVTIARHGTREATRSDVFLNYAHYGQPDAPLRMDYFLWILRRRDQVVLVDTGYSPSGAERRGREVLMPVPDLLARVGIDPGEVSLVIISHAHYDHIGNLDAFPNARFLIASDELDFWNGPLADRELFHHSVEDAELAQLNALVDDGRVETFSGSHRPADGIEIIQVGGHTPGQCIVLVGTDAGVVLIASDAVHYYEELDADMPFSSVTDVAGMYDAFVTIRALLDSGRATHLVAGHDPGTLARFAAAPGLEGTAALIGASVARTPAS